MDDKSDKYEFTNLFNLDEVQRIQDEVSATLHVGSIIVKPDGTPITKPSNFCNFCYNVVRSTKKGCDNCFKSDAYLGRPCEDHPNISPCLSANLSDAGCSIIVNGVHVASWMLGQVRNSDIETPPNRLTKYAEEIGVDPELYIREYSKIPTMSSEEFTHIANLIFIIAKQLSSLAYHNILLSEELEHKNILEARLQLEHKRLTYSSTHDNLTNVFNRTYFEEQVAIYDDSDIVPISIVVGDVNNLKVINDIFGHKHGDILLTTICNYMIKSAKDNYIICRCGGDEFNIIMPGADYTEAKQFCKKVYDLCQADKSNVITPSISFGIDSRSSGKKPLSSVLRTADALMYKNKQNDKMTSNILIDIRNVLYNKGYLKEDIVEKTLVLSNSFGVYLQLNSEQLQDLNLMTELQDLGMIVVPDKIYFKSEPLTPEEFELIKDHPAISYRLARLYDNTVSVARLVQHCHENYDGTGYPSKLRGDNIPYESRIIALINGFTAMVNVRPYGREFSKDEALEELQRCSGNQYDPDLVVKFTNFMKDYNY